MELKIRIECWTDGAVCEPSKSDKPHTTADEFFLKHADHIGRAILLGSMLDIEKELTERRD